MEEGLPSSPCAYAATKFEGVRARREMLSEWKISATPSLTPWTPVLDVVSVVGIAIVVWWILSRLVKLVTPRPVPLAVYVVRWQEMGDEWDSHAKIWRCGILLKRQNIHLHFDRAMNFARKLWVMRGIPCTIVCRNVVGERFVAKLPEKEENHA